jgi:GNAT superfamily N-acetyltransferase
LSEVPVPEAVRQAALFPEFDLPEPPPGHPVRRVRGDDYLITFTGPFAVVAVRALPRDAIEARVAEIRMRIVAEGFEQALWSVPEEAAPLGLAARLGELGLAQGQEALGWEPRAASMALVGEPPPGPSEVEVRRPRTFEEFVAAGRVAGDALGMSARDRRVFDAQQRELWEWVQRWPNAQRFVALIDGEVIGCASAAFGRHAAYLMGGSVQPDMRGRGAYRALVRARWDAAVEHDTPALTVSAGAMSRPILERLGFVTVGFADGLSDLRR